MYFEKFYESVAVQDPDNSGNDLEQIEDDVLASHDEEVDDAAYGFPGEEEDLNEAAYELMFEAEYNMDVVFKAVGLYELNEVSRPSFTDKIKNSDFYTKRIVPIIEGFKKVIGSIWRKIQEVYYRFITFFKDIDGSLKEFYNKNKNELTDDNLTKGSRIVFTAKNGIMENKRIVDKDNFIYTKFTSAEIRSRYFGIIGIDEYVANMLNKMDDIKALENTQSDMREELYKNFDQEKYYNSITKEIDEMNRQDLDYIVNRLNLGEISNGFKIIQKVNNKLKYVGVPEVLKEKMAKESDNAEDKSKATDRLKVIFENYTKMLKEVNYNIKIVSLKFISAMRAAKTSKNIALNVIKAAIRKEENNA